MGSRNGVGPHILRAHRGFEPTRWQDQTLVSPDTVYPWNSGCDPKKR